MRKIGLVHLVGMVGMWCLHCAGEDNANMDVVPVYGAGAAGMPIAMAGAAGAGAGGAGAGGASAGAAGSAGSAGAIAMAGASPGGSGGMAGSGGQQPVAGAAGMGGGPAIAADQALYAEKCGTCHGELGEGNLIGPGIQHIVDDGHADYVVRNGIEGTAMVAMGMDVVSDADLQTIYGFLNRQPRPTTGAALYGDFCANCHGADGSGGPTMRDIRNELGEVDDTVRNGAHAGEYELRNEYMPAFSEEALSTAELELIKTFMQNGFQ